jgi:hypothetical protein
MAGKFDFRAMEVLLEAMITGDGSGAILNQEKRGQQEVVRSEILPRDVKEYRDPRSATELYAAMGIEIISEADDSFFCVKLPDGWTKQATDHSMWSKVLDEKGRERLSVFYKAAFYDRSAHAHLCRRYGFTGLYDKSENADRTVIITDSGKEIHRFVFEVDNPRDTYEKYRILGESYLNEHYPDHRNPFAYWDECPGEPAPMIDIPQDTAETDHTFIIELPLTVDMTGQEDVKARLQEIADAAEQQGGVALTTPSSVADYMRQAKNVDDWDQRIRDVKKANKGDYPPFWFVTIIISGLAAEVSSKW